LMDELNHDNLLHRLTEKLNLIDLRPRQRKEPLTGDLVGDFDLWFDGGAVKTSKNSDQYYFKDGTKAIAWKGDRKILEINFIIGYGLKYDPLKTESAENGETYINIIIQKNDAYDIQTTQPKLLDEQNEKEEYEFSWQGRWKPIEKIGQGGMGETWKAKDSKTNKIVCIKQLQPITDRSNLVQEYKALQKLSHPGIVEIIDFNFDSRHPYIVLEFVSGITLSEYINNHKLLVEPVIVELARQIFSALSYAHSQEILHCDIKPGNIMVQGAHGKIKTTIIDYGLAIVDRYDNKGMETGEGRQAGTPVYMAPEQYKGSILTGKADVYAVGEIMWEMVMGKRPFPELPIQGMFEKANAKNGLQIRNAPFPVSESFTSLIQACTQPNPDKRPTADQALVTLERLAKYEHPINLAPYNLRFQEYYFQEDRSPKDSGKLEHLLIGSEVDEAIDFYNLERCLPGWFDSNGFVANVSKDFSWGINEDLEQYGENGILLTRTLDPSKFSSIMQRIPGKYLCGKKIRFSAYLSCESLSDWGGMWMRIDGLGKTLFFENMSQSPLRGTTPWKSFAIDTRVPKGTEWINFGFLLQGIGTIEAKNINIEIEMYDSTWLSLSLWSSQDNRLIQDQNVESRRHDPLT
jgi:serine/threonine protein kinase